MAPPEASLGSGFQVTTIELPVCSTMMFVGAAVGATSEWKRRTPARKPIPCGDHRAIRRIKRNFDAAAKPVVGNLNACVADRMDDVRPTASS